MDFTAAPFYRNPFTDLGGFVINHQIWGPCAKAEMRAMNCLEAYGLNRGQEKCSEYINDYHECFTSRTQLKRALFMKLERKRQYSAGEREKRYAEDPLSTSF